MKRKKKQHFNWNILIIDTIIFSIVVGLIWTSFWWSGFKNSLAINKIVESGVPSECAAAAA